MENKSNIILESINIKIILQIIINNKIYKITFNDFQWRIKQHGLVMSKHYEFCKYTMA